jgi:hypothetical protein
MWGLVPGGRAHLVREIVQIDRAIARVACGRRIVGWATYPDWLIGNDERCKRCVEIAEKGKG